MTRLLLKWGSLLIIVLAIILVAGCNKNEQHATGDIVGLWTVSSSNVDITVGTQPVKQYLIDNFGYSEADAQTLLDFYVILIQQDYTGTIEFYSDYYYDSYIGEYSDGEWSISSDEKTITLDAGTIWEMTLDVVSLTPNLLIVKLPPQTEEVDLDNNGSDETTVTIKIELTLTK